MSLTVQVTESDLDDKNKKDETVWPLLKETLREWAMESYVPGISRIVSSSHSIPLRILWALALVTSAAYCIVLLVQVFQNYYAFPSSTKISVIQELPTDFPVISFCNMKLLNRSSPATKIFIGNNSMLSDPNLNEASIRYYFAIENLTVTERKQYCFQLEGMLISDNDTCRFRNAKCSSNDFQYFYSPQYGNCYSFNSGTLNNGTKTKIAKAYTSGQGSGLDLELFIGNPAATEDTFDESYDGLVISIHNQSIAPFSSGNVIKVSVNTRTDILINRDFLTKLPQPYGDCLQDTSNSSSFSSPYFDYIVKVLRTNYSQDYCQQFCIQTQTIKYCNCSSVFLPLYQNSTKICNTQTECMYNVVGTYGDQFVSSCKAACPFECYSIGYSTTTYQSYYPTDNRKEELNKLYNSTIAYADMQLAFLKVSIYYQKMLYNQIEQLASFDDSALAANFGGALGLCLGKYFL